MRERSLEVEEFEELAARAPEDVRLEFLDGRLEERCAPDGDHATVMAWLQRQFVLQRPELWLYPGRGLRTGVEGADRLVPDGVLVPEGWFAGDGEWSEAEGALLVVEVAPGGTRDPSASVTSRSYAAAGVGVYLLVDRREGALRVHRNPDPGRSWFADVHTAPFGELVRLPDPVSVTLDTEVLKDYVR